ncbi:MAG: hypothetical protein BM556_01275 [Bacteriovorax sp. MedPE-SWde]|nr:MAG: hypothetical protein BM556_01275 [Bacteriovorax sp. MedPE-SWde]
MMKQQSSRKKFNFSILVSLIFVLLLGIPIYGVLYTSASHSKIEIERELKNGQAYASKYNQMQVELFISRISVFLRSTSQNIAVINAFTNGKNINRELEKIYDSESGQDIDFLFVHSEINNHHGNISSSLYNTDKISNFLNKPILKLNKDIRIAMTRDEDNKPLVFAYSTRPIVSPESGEAIGDITAGIILNNNLNMLERLKETDNLLDIDAFFGETKILDLAHHKGTHLFTDVSNNEVLVKGDQIISPFKLNYIGAENIKFFSTYKSNAFQHLNEKFDNEKIILLFVIIGLTLLFFLIFNILVTRPLTRLVEYTKRTADFFKDTKPSFGIINEFENLGEEFYKAFSKLAHLNQGLEQEVKERTLEIEEKRDLLQQQLIEVKSLQERMIAQEKLTSMGLLLAGVSHEIRNPLNLIQNSALILKDIVEEIDEEKDTEKRLELFEEHKNVFNEVSNIVIQHSQRSTRIIKSMLDQSRGSSPDKTLVDIKEVILTNLNYINKATNTAFYLRTEITKDFAEIDKILVYERELGQVLINILENSFYALIKKHDKIGDSFTPKLELSTEVIDNKIVIKIKDNGIGIPAHIVADIFSAFKTTKPAGEGTGLGLSVSKDIIKKHDGTISVNSQEGEFTEFTIRLPMIKK